MVLLLKCALRLSFYFILFMSLQTHLKVRQSDGLG